MTIKDYIYLDEESLNSSLAQFQKGLIDSYASESESEQGNKKNKSKKYVGGLDGILSIGITGLIETETGAEESSNNSQKEIINSIIHDYAVDLLISSCKDKNLLSEDINLSDEGTFILFNSDFHIYDFEYLEDIMSEPNLELLQKISLPDELKKTQIELNIMKKKGSNRDSTFKAKIKRMQNQIDEAYKKNAESFDILNTIHLLGRFAKSAFSGSILVKATNSIALCKQHKFRMNRSQLAMLNDSKRKINILGIVEAAKYDMAAAPNPLTFQEIKENEINKIPSMLSEILLSSFHIMDKNDKFIKPIAIYFE